MVQFTTTGDEAKLIGKIAVRAAKLGMLTGWYDRQTLIMDMTAAHSNGCPIDFERLLSADDFNFAHDVAGIANHIDRETGKLAGHFLPRFSKREPVASAA